MNDFMLAMVLLPGLAVGITVHEFAHAWSASLLGDNFARRQGRVSLNPFRHLTLLGTLALFVVKFGWGRPVPVNLYNFKHPRRDYLLTSLAGPAANVLFVGVCWALMLLTRRTYALGREGEILLHLAHVLLLLTALINTILAVINLIPIPPLDGSKIWPAILPGLKNTLEKRASWLGLGLILLLIYTGSLRPMFRFVSDGVTAIMPVSDRDIFEAHFERAEQALEKDRYAEAERHCTRALEINNYSSACLFSRAVARGMQDRWEPALEDANRAIELNGDIPLFYEYRATILQSLGRFDQADADLEMARSLRIVAGEESGRPTDADTQPATRTTRPGASQPDTSTVTPLTVPQVHTHVMVRARGALRAW